MGKSGSFSFVHLSVCLYTSMEQVKRRKVLVTAELCTDFLSGHVLNLVFFKIIRFRRDIMAIGEIKPGVKKVWGEDFFFFQQNTKIHYSCSAGGSGQLKEERTSLLNWRNVGASGWPLW